MISKYLVACPICKGERFRFNHEGIRSICYRCRGVGQVSEYESGWGGPRKNQTGRPPKPESEKHIKRQISLPPDVSARLDEVPIRQRSALIAQALREYWKRNNNV